MEPLDEAITTTTPVDRRRSPVLIWLLAAAAVVVAVAAVAGRGVDEAASPPPPSTTSTTPPSTTVDDVGPVSSWSRASGHAVALTQVEVIEGELIELGPLIVIDLTTGQVVHEVRLQEPIAYDVEIDRSGTVAYVSQATPADLDDPDCAGEWLRIHRIPLDPDAEFEPEFLDGVLPRLSPDGSRIAYFRSNTPDEKGCPARPGDILAVEEVATGERVEFELPPATSLRRPWIVWLDNEFVAVDGTVFRLTSAGPVDVALPDFGNAIPLGFDPFNEDWIIAGNATGRINPFTGVTTWDISPPPAAAALDATNRALLTVHRTDTGSSIDTGDTVVTVDRFITAIDW